MSQPASDRYPNLEQTGRIIAWMKIALLIISLGSAVSYSWISIMGIATEAQVDEKIAQVQDETVRPLVMELRDDVRSLDRRLERLEHTMICVLWEIEPENCESARRPGA